MKINWRNLLLVVAVVLPIGFTIGYYALDIGLGWTLALIAISSPIGLLLGLLGFKIREERE